MSGPCALCGHPNHAHRLWDAVLERFLAGESVAELATEYLCQDWEVEATLRQALADQRTRRRRRA